MDALTRFAAPAAFLLAVTIAVLVLRGAIADEAAPSPAATAAARPAPPPAPPRRATTAAPAAEGRFHVIRAGETLGAVADRYDTSVEALVELNPGVDPTALQVGQRVRVE
jgi:Tfp pilus assembly protein FimV